MSPPPLPISLAAGQTAPVSLMYNPPTIYAGTLNVTCALAYSGGDAAWAAAGATLRFTVFSDPVVQDVSVLGPASVLAGAQATLIVQPAVSTKPGAPTVFNVSCSLGWLSSDEVSLPAGTIIAQQLTYTAPSLAQLDQARPTNDRFSVPVEEDSSPAASSIDSKLLWRRLLLMEFMRPVFMRCSVLARWMPPLPLPLPTRPVRGRGSGGCTALLSAAAPMGCVRRRHDSTLGVFLCAHSDGDGCCPREGLERCENGRLG